MLLGKLDSYMQKTPKVKARKAKINKGDNIKTKNLLHWKGNQHKENPTYKIEENIFKNSYNLTAKNQTIQLKTGRGSK